MPKPDPLVAADTDCFEMMASLAVIMKSTDPLKAEVLEERWAQFGRTVYSNMHDERFRVAINMALLAADGKPEAYQIIVSKLRTFLLTGTIA